MSTRPIKRPFRRPRVRLVKKRVERAVAAGLSLTMVLDHARASFWELRDVGQQRRLIRQRLTTKFGPRGLGVHPNHARFITHDWTPEQYPKEWRRS